MNNTAYQALLVAVRLDGKLYRLTGLAPRGSGLLPRMEAAAETFRALSAAEASQLRGQEIDVVTVRSGDNVTSLAQRMNVDSAAEDRFRVLNGLGVGAPVRPGQQVKLIR